VPRQPLLNPLTPGAYVAPASAANRLAALRAPQRAAAAAAAAERNNIWDPNANNGTSPAAQAAQAAQAAHAQAVLAAQAARAAAEAEAEAAQEQQLAPAPAEPSPAGLFGNNGNAYEPTPETANKVRKINNYMAKDVNGKEKRKDKLENSIKFVREFLEKDSTPRSLALLEYVKEKYDGQTMAALEGEMDKKHIPVLRFILTLATSPDLEFIKALDTPIPTLFAKTDLNVRSNLITKVTPAFSGVITKMLATIKGKLMEQRAAQSGGGRKTRCGCGIKFGGRRTRRVRPRKTRKSRR
jgi:hypothetical protein